ncbi:MAG: hypothetical protein M0Z30_11505 [Actinomycetota bacterium]|nr:hypothetical protein [Actinomycetota bacterium]
MSNDEQVVAEQVVQMGQSGPMTVRISQHQVEEFWRVDVSRDSVGHTSVTVGAGDGFLMNLIQGAVSGESIAWRHLAHWGRDAIGRSCCSAPLFA